MDSQPSKKILILVLGEADATRKADHTDLAPNPEAMRALVGKQIQGAREAGMEIELMSIDERDMDNGKALAALQNKLKDHEFQGLCIDHGLVGPEEYTMFTETLINTCREQVPHLQWAFIAHPGVILDSLLRNFK